MGDWDTAMESMKEADEERNSEPKKSRRGYLLIVLIISIVAIAIGGVFVIGNITGTPEGTGSIPGDAANFDAPTSLQEVQLFAGDDVRFIEMTMNQVRPDGTLDLNAKYDPSVEYVFVRQMGDNAAYEYVIVTIKRTLGEGNRSNGDANSGGMSRSTRDVPASDVIPDRVVPPICPIEDLWQIAKSYDVPIVNAVAVIQYTQDGYHFTMADEEVDLQFTQECVVVQS